MPAAGRGIRMGAGKPKQLLEIQGRPILLHTLDAVAKASFIAGIHLVVHKEFAREIEDLILSYCAATPKEFFYLESGSKPSLTWAGKAFSEENEPASHLSGSDLPRFITLVEGGAERQDSVFNALEQLPDDCQWVFIHDGVRPFASVELMERTWKAALGTGAAICAVPATDTIKKVRSQRVVATLSREELWMVQTPQVFRKDVLISAYRHARQSGCVGTDDAFLLERLGEPVSVVMGERSNIKITTPEDLLWAEWFLSQKTCDAFLIKKRCN